MILKCVLINTCISDSRNSMIFFVYMKQYFDATSIQVRDLETRSGVLESIPRVVLSHILRPVLG